MAQYMGMTVDQRLLMSGMNFWFDEAAAAGDQKLMIQILIALEMAPDYAAQLVAKMFAGAADPAP